ncbi:hypothetical protein J2Z40_000213 [Cytobacillus eiseniae]|uniref:Uncharacterized protein n=1 Tax=Cytobacillus eiseniae TaxID=762947 RepID=A0ABS4R9U3_9BACI|nr:hypothetical protein [Cytobacillus eiseniae]
MRLIIVPLLIILFLYTFGFSIMLWREKNKMASFAVLGLAIATVVSAFFSVLK